MARQAHPPSRTRAPGGHRILIVKLSSFGDLFHALPAAHCLKVGLNASLDWVTQKEYVDLVRCFTDVDRVVAFPRRSVASGIAPFLRELRAARYDLVVDLQGLLKSAWITRMARAKRRLGPSFAREGSFVFYSAVAGKPNRARHAVEQILDVADYLRLPRTPVRFPVRFPAEPTGHPSPRVALVPFSRWETKNWPASFFGEVARQLRARVGATIFLVGGADSVPVCAEIEGVAGPAVNQAGKLSLVRTGSLLAEMDLVIGNDSGPIHMAAALGVPVLGIYGPTDPAKTGPYGPKSRTLVAEGPCRPCFGRKCRRGDLCCMTGITPERVSDAALAILNP